MDAALLGTSGTIGTIDFPVTLVSLSVPRRAAFALRQAGDGLGIVHPPPHFLSVVEHE